MISSHETLDTIIQTLEDLSDPVKINYLNENGEKLLALNPDFNKFCSLFSTLKTDDAKEILIKVFKIKLLEIMDTYSKIEYFRGLISLDLQEVFFDAVINNLPDFIAKSRFSYTMEFRDVSGLIQSARQKNVLFYAMINTLVEKSDKFADFQRVLQALGEPAQRKSFIIAAKEKLPRFIEEQQREYILLLILTFCSDVLNDFKQTLADIIKEASDFIFMLLNSPDPKKEILYDLIEERLIEIAKVSMASTDINIITNLLPLSRVKKFSDIINTLINQNVKFKKKVAFDPAIIENEFKADEVQPLKATDINTTKVSLLQLHSILKNPLAVADVKASEASGTSLLSEEAFDDITLVNTRFNKLSL